MNWTDPKAELALLAILMIWVASFIVFKLAFQEFDPMAFNMARFILMVPLAFGWLWVSERDLRLPQGTFWGMFLSSMLGFGVYQVFFINGLAMTTASSSSLLLATMPILSAIFLTVGGIERLSVWQWVGIVLAMIGVAAFVEFRPGAGFQGFTLGDLMILGAATCFAIYGILNKNIMQRMTPARVTAYGVLFGAIMLLPFSWKGLARQDWSAVSTQGWLFLVFQTIFPVYVAYLLWNWAIERQGVAKTVPISYLVPVLTGISAAIFLGEKLVGMQIVAGALVLCGVALSRSTPAWIKDRYFSEGEGGAPAPP